MIKEFIPKRLQNLELKKFVVGYKLLFYMFFLFFFIRRFSISTPKEKNIAK